MNAVDERWAAAFPWLTETQRSAPLLRMLQGAELAYRSSAAQLRAMGKEPEARKMERFASNARLDLEQPQLARWLHSATQSIRDASGLEATLESAMAAALSLLGADRGNIQLLDPASGELKIAVQCGFTSEFLEYFAIVSDSATACGRAATSGRQIVIGDVHADPRFAPHRDIAAATGFRAVQSTPIANGVGHIVGILSTHYPVPHRPSAGHLQFMVRYAERIAEIVTGTDKYAGRAIYQPQTA